MNSNEIDKASPQFVERLAPILPVRDIQTSLAHYRKLGFAAEAYEEDVDDTAYAFVCLGAVELHLVQLDDLDPEQTTSACYLFVGDADALYEQWREADIDGQLHRPEDTPYGLREFAHVDSDGNLLRIGAPLCPPDD